MTTSILKGLNYLILHKISFSLKLEIENYIFCFIKIMVKIDINFRDSECKLKSEIKKLSICYLLKSAV